MDAPVGNEPRERQARRLAPNRVERADNNDAGRVVDNDVDAGYLFKRADIAPFAANHAPLHFVVWDIDGARRRFRGVGRGVPLQRQQDNFARGRFAAFVHFFFMAQNNRAFFFRELFIELFEQAPARFFLSEIQDLVQSLLLRGDLFAKLVGQAALFLDLFGERLARVLNGSLVLSQLVPLLIENNLAFV